MRGRRDLKGKEGVKWRIIKSMRHEKGALLRRRRGSALEWAREKKEAGREGMKKNKEFIQMPL